MLTLREIVSSVYGAWRLAHLDRRGMAYFDVSEDGFWRSFRVAILMAPVAVLLVALHYSLPPPEGVPARAIGSWGRVFVVETIGYAISWMAYPLAAHYLVMALDREREYVGYIVAYNWSAVLQYGLLLLVVLINAASLLPDLLGALLMVATQITLLFYSWFIARAALGVSGLQAAGLVSVAFMIDLLLYHVTDAMVY